MLVGLDGEVEEVVVERVVVDVPDAVVVDVGADDVEVVTEVEPAEVVVELVGVLLADDVVVLPATFTVPVMYAWMLQW